MRQDEIISGIGVERRGSMSVERSGREEGNSGPGVFRCRKMRGEMWQQRLRRTVSQVGGEPRNNVSWESSGERQCVQDEGSDQLSKAADRSGQARPKN